MNRFLSILLIFLLPMQLSWSAAAAYCTHASTEIVGHLGHHEHKHQAEPDVQHEPLIAIDANVDFELNKLSGEVELDCGHCHSSTFFFLISLPKGLTDRTVDGPSMDSDRHPEVGSLIRFERPKWLTLA